jgi:ABC-type antimicrobial peptide transport system permease subunit
VSSESINLRPQVRLIGGRMFTPGTREIIVGTNAEKRFAGCQIGNQLKFGNASWTVVGVIDAGGTAFDTEIWGDVEQIMPSFGRPVYSSVTARLRSASELQSFKTKIESDRRTNYLEVKSEPGYYLEQSQIMATFIRILGIVVTVIFSIGAIIGAMITMYAAVANRTVEIGTLRALGFRRRSILAAFMVESLAIAIIGAAIGLAGSSFLQLFVISTLNFGTFSELAFSFDMTTSVVLATIAFAMAMGISGGLLPAARAARLRIVNALRAAA